MRKTLAMGLAFGVVTQALFWDAPLGANVLVFVGVVLVASALVRRPTPAGLLLAMLAVIAGGSMTLRASTWSLVLGVPSTAALLLCAMAAPSTIADVPFALFRFFGRVPAGSVDAARMIPAAIGGEARPLVVRGFLGVGIGLPIAGVFGGLLAADESFRGAVVAVTDRVGTATGFATASIATAFGALAVFGAARSVPSARRAPSDLPYRIDANAPHFTAPHAPKPSLSVFTWGIVLAQVALVFLVFVAANLRHLFGGVALVHADRSLTYASYLHSGVAELVVASTLSIGLVVLGHALITPHGERVARGGLALASLEVAVLSLSALTLVSCAQRLLIYEDAYGATYKRLGVLVVGLVVLSVLAATALKSAKRGWNGWGGWTTAGVLGVLALSSAYDADGRVAKRNLDRAAAGAMLDDDYLATLGPDACASIDHPVLRERLEVRDRLRERWAAPDAGWRSRRGLVRCP